MREYVLGFCISNHSTAPGMVLLVERAEGRYLAGKLNGVGGKIEEHEMPDEAMNREFWEETKIMIQPEDWPHHMIIRNE